MARSTWWGCAAFLGLLGGTTALRAEEGARDLTPAVTWVVGDVLTRTEELDIVVEDHTGGKGYSSGSSKNATLVKAQWLEQCQAVGADGQRTAYRAYVVDWSRKQNKDIDVSLKGRFVLVAGVGAKRGWTLEGDKKPPTTGATEWLDSAFGPGERDYPMDALLPADAVAPGASWMPDIPSLAEAAFGSAAALDAARAAGSVTFKAVEAEHAALSWDLSVPWPTMPVQGEKPWAQGGVWHITGTALVASDGRVGVADEHWGLAVEGEGVAKEAKDGNGPLLYSMKLACKIHRTRELKGKLPEGPESSAGR